MNAEVLTIRGSHNFSPNNSIQKVANALWRHVDAEKFRTALKSISAEALDF